MEELLKSIEDTITQYRSLNNTLVFEDKEIINGMMKNLSSDLFFLGKYLDDYRQDFYSTIVKLLKNHSATEAEKRAKDLHPEKRQLERFINSSWKVWESMRSNQSFLKKENN